MRLTKCKCGDPGRYQNMVCGQFVWTCGTQGCLKEKPTTTSGHTDTPGVNKHNANVDYEPLILEGFYRVYQTDKAMLVTNGTRKGWIPFAAVVGVEHNPAKIIYAHWFKPELELC